MRKAGEKKDKEKVYKGSGRNNIPLEFHLSGVKGQSSVKGVGVVGSFASFPLPLLLPAVHLHHLLLLL